MSKSKFMDSLFNNQPPSSQLRSEHALNQQHLRAIMGRENYEALKKMKLNASSKDLSNASSKAPSSNLPPMLQKIFANASPIAEHSTLVRNSKLLKRIST